MFASYARDSLFYTPLFRYEVAGHAALDAALLAEGAAMREQSEGVNKSNRGGWHSEGNIFDRDSDCIQLLRDTVDKALAHALTGLSPKLDQSGLSHKVFGWMNVNPPGGFNAPHTHPGAHWSGVYYVNQPEIEEGNSGMIEFLDPRTDQANMRLFKAQAFRLKKKVRPGAGEMIIFPSYLVHWVYPNESGEERVTVAWNATFRKRKK